ncbi:terminase large subunit [Candidatus Dojkabacteria bacterium]|uniref:Terminase large subunit n=1 Tax=Candidatus Dojkabacteria bacterium TaxID=2099670 RepID=A0A5C7J9M4_9BACT|nr:MAG: terminase large subunit [Candidatus Dojkabacteria bacterium]
MKFDKNKYPFCFKGDQYAKDVVSKKITACKYIISACERYLKDVDNENATFYFDKDAAEKYLRLVQKFNHVKGYWPTKNIIYQPWQCWIFMNIMGFKNKDSGFRRFRTAHLEIARGQGKSLMASQMALYFLALDNPAGNTISCVATKTDQARIVLDDARAMAQKNPSFLNANKVKVLAHKIVHPSSNSVVRALSADYGGLDGLNDVLAICDELHAMRREIFEVITSGMSKRKDSLLFCITTAGSDTSSIGYFQTQFAKKVATGEVSDDSFFSSVYTLDDEDHWSDESVWIKANPNLGISVDLDSLRAKADKALVTPSDIPNLRIKHFNTWISEANAFFDLSAWDKCEDKTLKIENFKGKSVRIGLDMASHVDIASLGYVFKEKDIFYVFDKSYLPEETITKKNNPFYDTCISEGSLTQTPGAAISYETFKNQLREDRKIFRIQETMYDPWNSSQLAQELSSDIEMVKFSMNTANFSEPMKTLDALLKSGKIRHNGSSLLRWCLGNVVAKEDHNGNVFPRKQHEKLKIDPIVAILMGLAGWIASENEESVYEVRGIRTI